MRLPQERILTVPAAILHGNSFTVADSTKCGANAGRLFLHILQMPPNPQALAILQARQEQEVRPPPALPFLLLSRDA